jgi:hypothetical protein
LPEASPAAGRAVARTGGADVSPVQAWPTGAQQLDRDRHTPAILLPLVLATLVLHLGRKGHDRLGSNKIGDHQPGKRTVLETAKMRVCEVLLPVRSGTRGWPRIFLLVDACDFGGAQGAFQRRSRDQRSAIARIGDDPAELNGIDDLLVRLLLGVGAEGLVEALCDITRKGDPADGAGLKVPPIGQE